jgi:hypothetical protein
LALLLLVLFLSVSEQLGFFVGFSMVAFFIYLAICAAEALRLDWLTRFWRRSPHCCYGHCDVNPACGRLARFPLTWIFLGLAGFWCLWEILLRHSDFKNGRPWQSVSALVATYLYIPTNCGVPT